MWNNYTVHMLNPGKMADREAEARAHRLAADGGSAETGSADAGTSWLTRGIEKATSSGMSRAARHRAAVMAMRLRHVDAPALTSGHHRA